MANWLVKSRNGTGMWVFIGCLGFFYRLRRTIAQFMVLLKFVLKTSFGITGKLKAHKPSKLVPASLFLALQHCSCCSVMATFQLHNPTCWRKQSAPRELGECVSYLKLESRAEGLFCVCLSVTHDNVRKSGFVLGLCQLMPVVSCGKSTGLKCFIPSFA